MQRSEVAHRSSSHVNKTIVVVLIVGSIVAQIYVINPDVCRVLDSNCILVCGLYILVHGVADDDIGCVHNGQTNANDFYACQKSLGSTNCVRLTAVASNDRLV